MTDAEIVEIYVKSIFPDTKVKVEEDGMIFFRGFIIYKEEGKYHLQKMIYFSGNREEPPSEDFEDLPGDSSEHLHHVVKAAIVHEVGERLADVGESIYYHQEQEFETTQEVVES